MQPTPDGLIIIQTGLEGLIEGPPWPLQVLLVVAALFSASVCYRLTDVSGRFARRLRSRLLLGIPWGTGLMVAFLLFVYLFVQGAYSGDIFSPRRPVTYAFTAWSYDYPLGVLTAAFSHNGFGHFLNNTIALVVFGSVAEYWLQHFPVERGAQEGESATKSPYVRPVLFFLGLLVVGVFTAAFVPGPTIGFSGVVFALGGFALVVRPLLTVGGLLMTAVIGTLYNTFTTPISTAAPRVAFSDVWFADISVLGHLLGFLTGVLLAVALSRRRSTWPKPNHLWAAVIVFGLLQNLWLAYWPLGNGRYALFRAGGVAFLFVLAAVVIVSTNGSGRPSIPLADRLSERVRSEIPPRRQVATMALVVCVVGLSFGGIATHLQSVDTTELPNDPVQVRDYQVGYAENVTNELYSVVDVPGLDQENSIQASGVIVYSDQRNVWQVATSTSRLASSGFARVVVGGVGWRETVDVTRTGWSVVGGSEAYLVRLYPPAASSRVVFTSEPATSEVVIANRSIAIRPAETTFEVVVSRDNETLDAAALPGDGENETIGGLRFERQGRNLYASFDGTRVRVANLKIPPTRRS